VTVAEPHRDPAPTGRELLRRLTTRVVGRRRELEAVVAALGADRHLLLEGPPGTGKSTVLRAVAQESGVGFEFVEGNAELTPARLVGTFDPAAVLSEGYSPEVFVDGPLVSALRDGSLLYVEEINRIPEETLNVLITVMSERELHVPRLGRVAAAAGFRLVAAMNPFDAIGTARISGAVYDRVCRLSVGYQDADDEVAIVQRALSGAVNPTWLAGAVEVVRRTRSHPDVRIGSSVRGAIDCAAVAASLASLRGVPAYDEHVGLDAALVALSGRLRLREGCNRTAEDIVTELWREVFAPAADAEGGQGKAAAPGGASRG
jgi:MoxR-like ATPase